MPTACRFLRTQVTAVAVIALGDAAGTRDAAATMLLVAVLAAAVAVVAAAALAAGTDVTPRTRKGAHTAILNFRNSINPKNILD